MQGTLVPAIINMTNLILGVAFNLESSFNLNFNLNAVTCQYLSPAGLHQSIRMIVQKN